MVGHYSTGNFQITAGTDGTVVITDPAVPNGGNVTSCRPRPTPEAWCLRLQQSRQHLHCVPVICSAGEREPGNGYACWSRDRDIQLISASHRLVCWAQPRRPPPAQRRGRKKARPSAHTNSPVPDRRRLYADMAKPNLNADNPKEGLTADGYGVLPPTRSSVSLLTGSAGQPLREARRRSELRRRQNARNALPRHGRPHRARRDGSRFTFHPVASLIPDHFLSTSPGTF